MQFRSFIGFAAACAFGASSTWATPPENNSTSAAGATAPSKVDVKALLASNACLACHGLTKRIVGPGFNEIAQRYESDPQAAATLEASIRDGSSGKWGGAMPPHTTLKPEELKALATFVLDQK